MNEMHVMCSEAADG